MGALRGKKSYSSSSREGEKAEEENRLRQEQLMTQYNMQMQSQGGMGNYGGFVAYREE